jgi:hypothetical protein
MGISKNSKKKFNVQCIDCGNIYNMDVATIVRNAGVPCICKDTISYPNKLSYYLFDFLVNDGQADYHESEYSPDWAGRYRYDNYIIKGQKEYLVEMDSSLGHGNKTFYGTKDIEGKVRDTIKDDLAKKHNIELIRIDCYVPRIDYIKKSILSSPLIEVFDLFNIDWELLDERATKNIHKKICLDYASKEYSI